MNIFKAGDKVFRIEFLPADICFETKTCCKWQVRQYEIVRMTKMYVWVKTSNIERRFSIKDFKKYGVYISKMAAIGKIEQILKKEIIELENKLQRLEKELNDFYKENIYVG